MLILEKANKICYNAHVTISCISNMEGKAMKKRIFSILTFLLMAVCLVGCGVAQVSEERRKEFIEVAENIKNNPKYQLPEGFTFCQENNTKNGRIVVIAKEEENEDHIQRATLDITQEEVQLEKIEVDFGGDLFVAILISAVIGLIVGILLMIRI